MKFLQDLIVKFNLMSAEEQSRIILRWSQIITLLCAFSLILLFYPFFPAPIRLIAIPSTMIGAYFLSTSLVSKIISSEFGIGSDLKKENITIPLELFSLLKPALKKLESIRSLTQVGLLVSIALFICGYLAFSFH